jgi:DNA-binding CsgD family transcriptional regulator
MHKASSRGLKNLSETRSWSDFVPREIEILSMVAFGAKNEQIADKLFISPNTVKTHVYNIFKISPNTVKTHVYNIFKKISVPNRLQAALWAAKNL